MTGFFRGRTLAPAPAAPFVFSLTHAFSGEDVRLPGDLLQRLISHFVRSASGLPSVGPLCAATFCRPDSGAINKEAGPIRFRSVECTFATVAYEVTVIITAGFSGQLCPAEHPYVNSLKKEFSEHSPPLVAGQLNDIIFNPPLPPGSIFGRAPQTRFPPIGQRPPGF